MPKFPSTLALATLAAAVAPHTAAQTITVTEVTQPSLAISPDGETLYFQVLGDLVAVPARGGDGRALTSGPGYDRAPLPASDGDAVVFVSDRHGGADRLCQLDLASGVVKTIEGDVAMHARTLRFARDGARLGIDGRDRQRPIVRLRGEDYSVHHRPEGDERIEWAGVGPDGQWAVLATSGPWKNRQPDRVRVRVVDLSTGSVLASLDDQIWTGETDRTTRAAISDRAAFVPLAGAIVRVDLETGAAQRLDWSVEVASDVAKPVRGRGWGIDPTAPPRGIDRVHPDPSGESVVFAVLGDVWRQAVDGAAVRVTSGPAVDRMPQFGPAGEWIYFARDGELCRVQSDGGVVEALGLRVATEFVDLFELAPDGARVVHPIGMTNPGAQIADWSRGSEWTPVLRGRRQRGAWVTHPSWGRDGTEILVTARLGTRVPQIYSINAAAEEPRALSEFRRPPHLVVGSRDGAWLAVLRDGRAHLAERGEGSLRDNDLHAVGPTGAHSLAFSADSKELWVAAGLAVHVFDCDTGEARRTLELKPRVHPPATPPPLVLDGCHVVDVESGELLRDRRVRLANGRIEAIENRDEPLAVDVQRIDARGLYLIPGLLDLHVHQVAVSGKQMLAWGVTTVRQLGSVWPWQLTELELIARGELLGPRHVSAGEIFEGARPAWGNAFHIIESPEEATALIERRARDGVDTVKLYPTLPRSLQRVVLARARALQVSTTMHVSSLRELVTAVVDGAGCLEHWPEELPALHGDVLELLRHSGVAWCPTLSVRGAGDVKRRRERAEFEEPLFRATVDPVSLRLWSARPKVGPMSDANLERLVRSRARDVARAARGGVTVVVGSDCSLGNALVGPSTHWEMEFMVRGGAAPLEALRAATVLPARWLGLEDTGVVRRGARADLVLLEANPLDDIRATRRVAAVVSAGRLLAR